MAQRIKVITEKSEDLSSIPETHMVEAENTFSVSLSLPL